MIEMQIAMFFFFCSMQVFIPEWPVEEGWEDRMCKHLKKVGDNFPINNKLSLQKEASRKHPRIVDTGLS